MPSGWMKNRSYLKLKVDEFIKNCKKDGNFSQLNEINKLLTYNALEMIPTVFSC